MFTMFTFFLSFILLIAWVFESKKQGNFEYPAILGFFSVLEYIAIPYLTIALLYIIKFEYADLAKYVNYPIGLFVSVLILGTAFVIKMANKYVK